MSELRGAVIGAGMMGRHHVRILSARPDVNLVAVVDSGITQEHPHLAGTSAPLLASIDELPPVDFAVVAVPTEHHERVALALIERGVSILVEKPLAGSISEAEAIVHAAREAGVVLAVGHVERFNPAVQMAVEVSTAPRFVQIERLSPYTPRIRDSVVFDLMIHDLDLACWICGGEPTRVSAGGTPVISDVLDVASAVLEFDNGCIAAVQASRVTQDKIRRLSISELDRFIHADSVRQDVTVRRQTTMEYVGVDSPVYRAASVVEIPYLDRNGEPLAREISDFVDAIRSGVQPTVGGDAGLQAVRLATAVEAAATA